MESNQSHKEDFPEILSSRALTMKDVEKFSNGDRSSGSYLVDCMESTGSNERLLGQDFIFATVKYQKKKYIFIHGFPGDIATGAFFDENYNTIYEIGEEDFGKNQPESWYNQVENWYNLLENEEGKLPDFMWPPCKLI